MKQAVRHHPRGRLEPRRQDRHLADGARRRRRAAPPCGRPAPPVRTSTPGVPRGVRGDERGGPGRGSSTTARSRGHGRVGYHPCERPATAAELTGGRASIRSSASSATRDQGRAGLPSTGPRPGSACARRRSRAGWAVGGLPPRPRGHRSTILDACAKGGRDDDKCDTPEVTGSRGTFSTGEGERPLAVGVALLASHQGCRLLQTPLKAGASTPSSRPCRRPTSAGAP